MNGLMLIDKPAGCTSHDVVNRWRKFAGTKRAGHLGTLDPMATGLLMLVTGAATRLAQFYGKSEKTYRAEITLGAVSNTYDAEGEVIESVYPFPMRKRFWRPSTNFADVSRRRRHRSPRRKSAAYLPINSCAKISRRSEAG